MVKIGLQIRAQLENVTNLTADGEDFRWYLKLKCNHCGEETQEYVYLTLESSHPLKGGRGQASLVLKCKLCSRENSIDIIKESIKPYRIEDNGQFRTIVEFDCRGVEPTSFSPRMGFIGEATESSTKFDDVDLKELDWADYDEKGQVPTSISELEHRFVKA